MSRIFDNIDQDLLTALRATMQVSLTVQCILPKKSWAVIQQLDELIANAFQLSPFEADYIAGYDIKYRIGQGNDD